MLIVNCAWAPFSFPLSLIKWTTTLLTSSLGSYREAKTRDEKENERKKKEKSSSEDKDKDVQQDDSSKQKL